MNDYMVILISDKAIKVYLKANYAIPHRIWLILIKKTNKNVSYT